MAKLSTVVIALVSAVSATSALASQAPSYDYAEGNFSQYDVDQDHHRAIAGTYSKRFGDLYGKGTLEMVNLDDTSAELYNATVGLGYIIPITSTTSFDISGHVGHSQLDIPGENYSSTFYNVEAQLRTKVVANFELFGAYGFGDGDRNEDESDDYFKLGAVYDLNKDWATTFSYTSYDSDVDVYSVGLRYSF